jgi:predicted nucleotidyltransferase
MRLTREQTEAIRQAAREAFGAGTDVWLFGSRVHDSKRGGDIDLLLRPQQPDQAMTRKLKLLRLLEQQLGERKIDILIETPDDPRPIVQVARETGVRL